jgi:hypothetical protein
VIDLTLSAEYEPDLEHLFPDPNGPATQANLACINDERWGARWTELRFFFFYLRNWAGLENLRKFAILQLRPTGFSEREEFRDHFRSKLALFSFEKGALGELWVKVRPSGYELFVDVTAPKVAKLIEAAIGRPLEKVEL